MPCSCFYCFIEFIIVAMEAELRLKMSYKSPSVNLGEKPYINVLPNYPYEAYRNIDQEKLAHIRKTQRLILMYTLPQTPIRSLPAPELLKQKLVTSALAQSQYTLNSISEKWLQEQQRIAKLQEVYEQFLSRREQLVSRAVMKSKHNVQDDAQKFKSSVKQIENEKNMRISTFMNRSSLGTTQQNHFKMVQSYNMQPQGELLPEEKEQLKAIERDADLKTVAHIRSQSEQNIVYEKQEQERLYGYRYMNTYLNEFEKALVFITGARHTQNLSQVSMVAEDSYYKTFTDKLAHFMQKIANFNKALMNHIFDQQMDIKHSKPHNPKQQSYLEHSQKLGKDLETQFYYYIPHILVNLEKDRQQLKSLNQYFTKNYQNYLDTYYSIKEVQLYHSRQTHIEQVIENERQALNQHLRKNFGMMVPYTKSNEYQELASLAISRDKPYLKTLMEQKISHLEQAIAYINYQHSKLYKQVCDGVPGVSGKIRKKLQDFSVLGSKYPQLRAHLQQSCQRLLQIVNH